MEPEAIEIPPQPAGERGKLAAFWVLMALLAGVIVLIDAPYQLGRNSTIMVKTETVINIKSAREKKKSTWPHDQTDPSFGSGQLAKAESTLPTFRFVDLLHDEHDAAVEIGVYQLKLRGKEETIRVRFNPNEKPRRKLF